MIEVHSCIPKLFSVHFSKTFVTLNVSFTRLVRNLCHKLCLFFFAVSVVNFFAFFYLIQRRLCSINITFFDQRFHIPIEECQKQRPDMSTVNIGIGTDYYFAPTKLVYVEGIYI